MKFSWKIFRLCSGFNFCRIRKRCSLDDHNFQRSPLHAKSRLQWQGPYNHCKFILLSSTNNFLNRPVSSSHHISDENWPLAKGIKNTKFEFWIKIIWFLSHKKDITYSLHDPAYPNVCYVSTSKTFSLIKWLKGLSMLGDVCPLKTKIN